MARCYVVAVESRRLSSGSDLIYNIVLPDLAFFVFRHCLTAVVIKESLVEELGNFKYSKLAVLSKDGIKRIVILCHPREETIERVIEGIRGNDDCARACKERGAELVLKPLDEYIAELEV